MPETVPNRFGLQGMKKLNNTVAMLGLAVLLPVVHFSPAAVAQDRRDEERREQRENNRRYHDSKRNDEHEWNEREDRAYRIWAKENHRKYRDFSKLRERDREDYWGWRHNHSDAELKIEIR